MQIQPQIPKVRNPALWGVFAVQLDMHSAFSLLLRHGLLDNSFFFSACLRDSDQLLHI